MTYPTNQPVSYIDVDVAEYELGRWGDDWADKHAAASLLEETLKPLLAQLTLKYRAGEKHKSDAETKALADPEYMEHVTRMIAARKEANRARVRYETIKTKVELQRTNSANDRALATMR
jgi:ribosomal protein L20A (L18A)